MYDDGSSFCFSCRSVNSAKISPYVAAHAEGQNPSTLCVPPVCYPSDVSQYYSEGAVAWCQKYGISVEQMLQNNLYYSPARDQLIFGFEADGKLLAYQARNLNPVSKSKRYYTCGDVNELLPIYHCRHPLSDNSVSRRLVLVEDCLSAIKVSYTEGLGASAMPLLGSGISRTKLTRLKHLYGALNVFLDPDMWHKSLNIVKQAQLLGFQARPISALDDPKALSYSELQDILK